MSCIDVLSICTDVVMYVHTFAAMYLYAYVHARIDKLMDLTMCTFIYLHVHVFINLSQIHKKRSMYTYIYINIHTYVYTYMQILVNLFALTCYISCLDMFGYIQYADVFQSMLICLLLVGCIEFFLKLVK